MSGFGRAVLLAGAVIAGGSVVVVETASTPAHLEAPAAVWLPYTSQVASLRFVGVDPQGDYFDGRVTGLSGEQVAQHLDEVGWKAATVLSGSEVVGGVTVHDGQRIWWGASK